ncbi:MAG: MBL fold metallo-hydrolase [Burkholderiales bacterium]|uniref:MBL fold metallo-hydrolase n=1 Tax=Nitrosomonas sp. TaxID=42353 RepID=UPI001DDD43F9|nr:MBL fold metallo-hydrolase [Nitrosomonas sp.]MCB1948915.1 MBL fold metallo-hydrolase [Nitrosomonas sp.]MCP5243305.1 MBL fold metallo-hydrolase [Burkholderiales bacterium]
MSPNINPFFETVTGTISYVVYDEITGSCAIIDPVLDYDPKSGCIRTTFTDKLIEFIQHQQLHVEWILETHAHADHLSSAYYIKKKLGGKIAIGDHIPTVQATFKKVFNLGDEFEPDGHHFDHLLASDETFQIGKLTAKTLFVPGHTPADIAYQIDDAIFVGDTLFMPDVGTARADFPGGDTQALYRSIKKILDFPAQTRLFMCHDYPPNGRNPAWETTVALQRAENIHVHDGIDEQAFITMRSQRDATLEAPVLLLPSIQINIRAGELPPPEDNGISYFKIPIKTS